MNRSRISCLRARQFARVRLRDEACASATLIRPLARRVCCRCTRRRLRLAPSERSESKGEMSEWLKEHAWKACVGETLPWVRIPSLRQPSLTLANAVSFGWQAMRRLSAVASAKADSDDQRGSIFGRHSLSRATGGGAALLRHGGFCARTNALMNRPSMSARTASSVTPASSRKCFASAAR